jgi:hypothetical protein
MENKGRSKATVETTSRALKRTSKNADINNPDTVEQYIARLKITDGSKRILCNAYAT